MHHANSNAHTLTVSSRITTQTHVEMFFALNAFGSLLGLVSRSLTRFLGAMGYYSRRPTKPDLPFGSLSFVIVGAGIAGLTAALVLKKKGHHVIVCHRNPPTICL